MSINDIKFYQFISDYQTINGNWVESVDSQFGNGDGTLTKSEFSKFLEQSWDWNGEESSLKDLVNKYWKEFDTNQGYGKIEGTNVYNMNGLDKNEINKSINKIDFYMGVKDYTNQHVTTLDIQDIIDPKYHAKWLSDATSEVLSRAEELYKQGKTWEEIEEQLNKEVQSIINKCTAEYCSLEYQEEVLNNVLKDYPDYKIGDDAVLQRLINNYLNSINSEAGPGNIQKEIRAIIDTYLAKAGLGKGGNADLTKYGYNGDKLNDLQKAVITKTIKNSLALEAENYKNYETEFETAVQQFINDLLKNDDCTFEELLTKASEFRNSEYKTHLDNTITIKETFGDFDIGDNLHSALVAKFGEQLANKIAENERYISVYKEIITSAISEVNAGKITMDEVQNFIIEEISINLEKFYTNGLSDLSTEELWAVYNQLATSAEAQKNDDEALRQHRNAAIKYCNAIVQKGASFKDAVVKVLGESYQTKITQMLPSEIKNAIKEINTAVAGMVETPEVPETPETPETPEVPETPNVPAVPETPETEEKLYNDEEFDYTSEWNSLDINLSIGGGNKVNHETYQQNATTLDVGSIMSSTTARGLLLANWSTSLATAIETAMYNINTIISEIFDALENAGFDPDLLRTAKQQTKAYYKAILSNMVDTSDTGNSKKDVSYRAYGETYTIAAEDTYEQWTGEFNADSNIISGGGMINQTSGSGIRLEEAWNADGGKNTGSDNEYIIAVNSKALLNTIRRFLGF